MPIAGDTTRLPYATGLTPLEKKLAHAQNYIAAHLGGTQAVRKVMGHCQFGARVTYGDCFFFALSPNEQRSALVLRLSRFRRNDPYTKSGSEAMRNLARSDYPSLEAKRQKTTTTSSRTQREAVDIELPEYDLRRALCARDPLVPRKGLRHGVETTHGCRCGQGIPRNRSAQRLGRQRRHHSGCDTGSASGGGGSTGHSKVVQT